nr:protein LONGIFOLIA 1-like isoform X2 [Coffea arabica]XP_027114855.1 protein LONGIFOLIA 1-like isoform X2 [Coffea arabica]
MMAGMVQDQNLEKQFEKQIGCMAGFFQLFDRHQLITGKKAYSTKRLPPSKVIDQGSENSAASSPAISRELSKPQALKHPATPKPEQSQIASVPELRSPELLPPKSPIPLPIFELKEGTRSSWKFCKEAPRLSLDSRATVDAKGSLHPREIRTSSAISSANAAGDGDDKQRRSPSVIARLMGLERLPDSNPDPEPAKKVELRRSASESRVSRDLFQYRCIDGNSNNYFFQVKQPNQQQHSVSQNANAAAIGNKCPYSKAARPVDHNINWYSTFPSNNANAMSQQPKALSRGGMVPSPWKAPPHRRSFFDTADVFPEPKQAATVSVCGDIERKLKMRGIDEPTKDLETLKQILEALQLKGLLHSNRPFEQRNLVYDRSFPSEGSPIAVMRPASPRMGNDSPASRYGVRRNSHMTSSGEYSPTVSPRREGSSDRNRSTRSPTGVRSESNARRPNNSIVKPKPLNVETQRRAAVANESTEKRRVCGVEAPKVSSRRNGCSPDHQAVVMNRLPRNRRSTGEMYHKEKITTVVTEDESCSISESTFSTSSQTDTEQRWKVEEYRGGKSLLERCDKLLHSIAEMNAADMQPSPVSVLDSSSLLFYKDESSSSSPSPVMKRSIDFKEDQSSEVDEETWGSVLFPVESKLEAAPEDYNDFVYISQVLLASHCLPEDSDIFLLLEEQQYLEGKDISKVSRLQRRLIFDVVAEILERNGHLPPWKAFSWSDSRTVKSSVRKVWSEFRRIRERDTAEEDLFDIIRGALEKDLAGDAINGWGECPVELSEAVLDIERLIFKDLIGETIRDLAAFGCKSITPRRKLVF